MSAAAAPRRPIAELVAELLAADVDRARLEARRQTLRAELEERAREVHRAEGMVPSWKARGLGSVSWCGAEADFVPILIDDDAYGEWCAENHPGSTYLRLEALVSRLTADAGDRLRALVDELANLPGVRIDYVPEARLLDGIAAGGHLDVETDDAGVVTRALLADSTGELVPGVSARRRAPYLSVRLDPQAKRRAALEGAGLDPDLADLEVAE